MYAFFERLLPPFPETDEHAPPPQLWAFCRYYARGSARYLLLMSLLTATLALLEVSLFSFIGRLVDWLSAYTPATLWQEAGQQLVWMALTLLVAIPGVVLLRTALIHQTLLGNFPMRIRWQAHRYLLGQSMAYYQHEFAGRLATKVMQTALAVRETILKLLDVMLYIAVYFTGVIILMVSLDVRLMLPFLAWLLCYIAVLKYFLPRLEQISTQQADARSEMTGRIVDTYTNMSTVKLFSHTQRESGYAREAMEIFLRTVYPQMRLASSLSVAVWCLNCLLMFCVGALAIYLWTEAAISTGAIAAAMGLILRLFGMSQWVMWEVSGLFENIGTVRDGINTFTATRKVQDVPQAPALQLHPHNNSGIEFRGLRFHYGKDKGLFENFSLRIRPGEKIGLVGRSGAGKSTLVNLLLRFYDVEGGAIYINGQNIAEVQQSSLRAHIGMVTQDTSLLHRSIRDNILYGRPEASEAEMIAAARQAQAHDFIIGLQDSQGRRGYEAQVGERGVTLSGGQRQRIAIARVLLKNAPILILDEATSALDSEVEAAIQDNLTPLMANKTVIAIAHRLSTIAALDTLIVLDQGRIVESGSHAELLRLGGIYAQLWAHQSGGFIGD